MTSRSSCSRFEGLHRRYRRESVDVDLGLAGKRALVLAAGGGLGSAVASSLAAEGTSIFLTDVDAAGLDPVRADVTGVAKSRVQAHACDLSRPGDIEALCDRALAAFDGIDILVNITGGPPAGPLAPSDAEHAQHHRVEVLVPRVIVDR